MAIAPPEQKQHNMVLDYSNKPLIMGVINVTPDSFSDGGDNYSLPAAVETAVAMEQAGADIIDIGPESSRPGSVSLSPAAQIERAVTVIRVLRERLTIPISIDAHDTSVARECIDAGASIINDITAGGDAGMFTLAAEKKCPIVLMHMKGMPETMQVNPQYDNVVSEVLGWLLMRAGEAESAGVDRDMIIIDPGIGFGKTVEHNIAILRELGCFVQSQYRVLLGASRKSFIGAVTGEDDPKKRLAGTIVTTVAAVQAGVDIIRVHDVPENLQAVKLAKVLSSC